MKKQRLKKRLRLNKKTISNLNSREMSNFRGGVVYSYGEDPTCRILCPDPPDPGPIRTDDSGCVSVGVTCDYCDPGTTDWSDTGEWYCGGC